MFFIVFGTKTGRCIYTLCRMEYKLDLYIVLRKSHYEDLDAKLNFPLELKVDNGSASI